MKRGKTLILIFFFLAVTHKIDFLFKGKKIFDIDSENCIQTIVQLCRFLEGRLFLLNRWFSFSDIPKKTSQEEEFGSVHRNISTRSQKLQNNDETSFILK